MGYGLLIVKSNDDIAKEEQAARDEANREVTEYESQLSAHIQKIWERNRWAREEWDEEMLRCLRQRNGEYDPDIKAEIEAMGGSSIYMMLTATKIRAAISWLRDILIPPGDKAWGLKPTPIPDIAPHIIEAIAERISTTLPPEPPEQGYEQYIQDRSTAIRDEILKVMRLMASDAATRMEARIEDQLDEGNWNEALSDFIEDFCTFPAAVIKGPIIRKKTTLQWGLNGKPIVGQKIQLEFKRVSPFDVYPAPFASTINDGDFIERIRFERRDIYDLIGLPGYSEDAIRAVLAEYGRGGLRDWLWRDYERARLEGKDRFWMRQDEGTIDGVHFFGTAQGLLLLEWGMNPDQIDDPLAEYEIDAIKIGRYVIRAVINKDPLKRRNYHKACFQKIPGGFWGIALPFLMRDIQRMCNASARALANNMGIASGPFVEVERDRLADGEDVSQLYPWMIFQTKSDKSGRGREAVRFYQANSNANELLAVFQQFEQRADDATNIPRYTYGNENIGGAGQTMGGLSMLMNNASKGIKLAISTIDNGVIKPVIDQTFTFNMLYDPDPTIKGDVNIIARGASALLTKEQAQVRRNEFLAMTNNPIDIDITGIEGRMEVLRASAQLLDLDTDKIVPTYPEYIARKQQEPPKQDPRLVAIQAKMQADQQNSVQQNTTAQKKMEQEYQLKEQQMLMNGNLQKEKAQMEYQLQLRMLEEKARQDEIAAELAREREAMIQERSLEAIREKVRLTQVAPTSPSIPPIVEDQNNG